MTENENTPENLRKFLESDDPALVMMGLSMAKGSGVPEEVLPTILGLYMWNDDKTVRIAAKSIFNKHASLDVKDKLKKVWKPQYRNKLFGDTFNDGMNYIYNFDENHENIVHGDYYPKRILASWFKFRDDFQKIILFYETFQSQEELACIILDPLIYFLGHKEFEEGFEHNPLTSFLIEISRKWYEDWKVKEDFAELFPEDYSDLRYELTSKAWVKTWVSLADWSNKNPGNDFIDDREGWFRLQVNAFRHPIIISAIKTLIGYGLVGSRSSRLHKEILPKNNEVAPKKKIVRKNVSYILDWIDRLDRYRIPKGMKKEGLIELLEHKSVHVRRNATWKLEKIGWKPETDKHRISLLLDDGDLDGCSKLGESAVEPLIKALEDGFRMYWDGINDSGWRSEKAAEALGKIGDTRAVEPLSKALSDESENIRKSAAKVLGKIGDTRAVEPLSKALSDESESIRASAAKALGDIGDAQAVEPLIQLLDTELKDLKQIRHSGAILKASEALGKIGDVRAVDCLIKVFTSYEKIKVRGPAGKLYGYGGLHEIKEALQNIGWQGTFALINGTNSEFLANEPFANSELKHILKKKGLSVSGKKEDLIKRLKEAK